MVLWHNEEDTQRSPQEVGAGEQLGLWIGTWPIEFGQYVFIEWRVTNGNDTAITGKLNAEWQYNDFGRSNSYWLATLGPFQEGDKVEYTIRGQSVGGVAGPITFSFTVGPPKASSEA